MDIVSALLQLLNAESSFPFEIYQQSIEVNVLSDSAEISFQKRSRISDRISRDMSQTRVVKWAQNSIVLFAKIAKIAKSQFATFAKIANFYFRKLFFV